MQVVTLVIGVLIAFAVACGGDDGATPSSSAAVLDPKGGVFQARIPCEATELPNPSPLPTPALTGCQRINQKRTLMVGTAGESFTLSRIY